MEVTEDGPCQCARILQEEEPRPNKDDVVGEEASLAEASSVSYRHASKLHASYFLNNKRAQAADTHFK